MWLSAWDAACVSLNKQGTRAGAERSASEGGTLSLQFFLQASETLMGEVVKHPFPRPAMFLQEAVSLLLISVCFLRQGLQTQLQADPELGSSCLSRPKAGIASMCLPT